MSIIASTLLVVDDLGLLQTLLLAQILRVISLPFQKQLL